MRWGAITSDAGGLLLREVELKAAIVQRFAACFEDRRTPLRAEHTVEELLKRRIFALALAGCAERSLMIDDDGMSGEDFGEYGRALKSSATGHGSGLPLIHVQAPATLD